MFNPKKAKKRKKTWLEAIMSAEPNGSSKEKKDSKESSSKVSKKDKIEETAVDSNDSKSNVSSSVSLPNSETAVNDVAADASSKVSEFQMEEFLLEDFYTLQGDIEVQGEDKPQSTTPSKVVVQPKGKGFFKGATSEPYVPKFYDKRVKLTIILVENSEEVIKEKDKLEKIVMSLATTGYIYVVNYGSAVRVSKLFEAKSFECSELLCQEDIGDKACLFDALVALESVVEKSYKGIEELKDKHEKVDSVDIIGIGRCTDNCSTFSSDIGTESFCKIYKNPNLVTKYFCLREENFIDAATIGFHSIGAFARNYM